MKLKLFFTLLVLHFAISNIYAQPDRWQQRVKYTMNIDMDVVANKFAGKQKLEYTNNSTDTLYKVFYHLYFNAFQPNSSMDVRSRELGKRVTPSGNADWDSRVKDRISKLTESEIGYQKILSLKMNGVVQPYKYHETILEVNLTKPILPKSKVIFDMDFEAQVPLQVRRSGRDNPTTGVRYSMSQWYPKLCEYDYEGWHPTPYIAREFYGVWGDFDVTINIDKDYKIGGTGVLQNANEIGWGYDAANSKELKKINTAKRLWKFAAQNVHDFVWAADPDYKHLVRKTPTTTLHVIYNYKPTDVTNEKNWETVADAAVTVLPFIEKTFGKYPYAQYSFIQGGDGGMEYPMATLLATSSIGTVFHEWMHSWYQMMLGTNESLYGWMDEGFTEYATNLVEAYYRDNVVRKNMLTNPAQLARMDSIANLLPLYHRDNYTGYFNLVKSGLEEPLTTHADHYNYNYAYSNAVYSKGAVFMEQLGYIIGAEKRNQLLLEYYNQWKFKHPNSADLIRLAEKMSNMKLDWYKEYFCNSTKTIDYSIDDLTEENGAFKVRLKRIGLMPMPIDCLLTFKDGTTEMHYIPLNLMYGSKMNENTAQPWFEHEEWRWTHPTYTFESKRLLRDLIKVEIDPSQRMADVDRKNNLLDLSNLK